MVIHRRAAALLITGILLSGPAASDTIPVDNMAFFDPAPISAPDELDRLQLLEIAAKAFAMQSWRITEINRAERYVDAELPVRVHVARLRITTRNGTFNFEYRPSERISHGWMREGDRWASPEPSNEDDREAAHRNYVAWVDEVQRTVGSLLQVKSLSVN